MNTFSFISKYHVMFNEDYMDKELAAIKIFTGGLSSIKTGKLINLATALLENDEVYLEIGTFSGFTLACAALYNGRSVCIGIDNLKFPGLELEEGKADIARNKIKYAKELVDGQNMMFVESDFRNVALEPTTKIGVFFVDGYHTKDEVLDNLKWAEPNIADNALIIFDDISIGGVWEGIDEWCRTHKDYHEFFRMDSISMKYWDRSVPLPLFWNGLSMVWRKKC